MWNVQRTPYFENSCKKYHLSKEFVESIENWAQTVIRVETPRIRLYFRSPNCKFEIWTARIPDKDHQKGSSGGFRLAYFFVLEDDEIYLDLLVDRAEIGYKKERPKAKEKFERHLREMKAELMEALEKQAGRTGK